MSEGYRPTPKEYLGKWLEPKGEALERQSMPFFEDGFEASYDQEKGIIEHQDSQNRMVIGYDMLESGFRDELKAMADEASRQEKRDEWKCFFSSPVLVLTKFRIEKVSNPEICLDINRFLADMVLVNPKPGVLKSGKAFKGEAGRMPFSLIMMDGNLSDIESILTLLHEAGHLMDEQQISQARKRLKKRSFLNSEEAATILKEERDAWAFALTKLKPFIDGRNRDFITGQIHKCSLTDYSESLRSMTAPDWVVRIMKFIEKRTQKKISETQSEE